MQTAYKAITAALAFAGCLSLLISGELNPAFLLPGLALIPGYYRYLTGKPPLSRWLIAGLALLELGVLGFDSLFVTTDFLIAIAHMTVVFQALKSFDFRDPWDQLQVYFMSLLQLIIASELSLSIAIGAVFILFLVIFMVALVLSHFLKEGTLGKVNFRRPLILISLMALVLTVSFFLIIPRMRSGLWGRRTAPAASSVGFSENVDFGSFGDVLEDPTIVMRVDLSGPRLPLYWKGATLDHFDGLRWTNTKKYNVRLNRMPGGKFKLAGGASPDVQLTTQRVVIEPLETDIVFGLGRIVGVEYPGWNLFYNYPSATMHMYEKVNRRFSYTLKSLPEAEYLERIDRAEYLQMPQEGIKGLPELARRVTEGMATESEKARRIESYLMNSFKYSLHVAEPPAGMSQIENFLFRDRTGYCEHYATSMALMLRAVGVPSRLVTGYAGGEENELGDYVLIRQSNAHSWVEAHIKGRWVRFDPTPPPVATLGSMIALAMDALRMNWYRYVIGFTQSDQVEIVRSLSMPVIEAPSIAGLKLGIRPIYLLLGLALTAVAAYYLLSRYARQRALSEGSRLYLRLAGLIRQKGGGALPVNFTPADLKREAARLKRGLGAELEEFLALYEESRFGARDFSQEESARMAELYKKLAKKVSSN